MPLSTVMSVGETKKDTERRETPSRDLSASVRAHGHGADTRDHSDSCCVMRQYLYCLTFIAADLVGLRRGGIRRH